MFLITKQTIINLQRQYSLNKSNNTERALESKAKNTIVTTSYDVPKIRATIMPYKPNT